MKSKQSKGENIRASIRWKLEGENTPKHYSKQLKDKYAKLNIWTLDAAILMKNIQNIAVTLSKFLNQLTTFYSHSSVIPIRSQSFLMPHHRGL